MEAQAPYIRGSRVFLRISARWRWILIAIVAALGSTHVQWKLFAAEERVSRKVAIVASGSKVDDEPAVRYSIDEESKKMVELLELSGYETTWFNRNAVAAAQGVSGGVARSVLSALDNLTLIRDDQLLLVVNGHGVVRLPGKQGHQVAFEDGSWLEMSELAEKIEPMIKIGVKVAVIDESCYSGNSLDLRSTGACVISAQDRFNVARTFTLLLKSNPIYFEHDFPHELRRAMIHGKGDNLEEIFLRARKALVSSLPHTTEPPESVADLLENLHYANDLPEISSWEHMALRDFWDQVFFSNDTEQWSMDLSPMASVSETPLERSLAEEFEAKIHQSFAKVPKFSYRRFSEMRKKRVAWLTELARLELPGVPSTQENLERKKMLIERLSATADDYRKLLGMVFMVERQIYDRFYRLLGKSLRDRQLFDNACRDFLL
jgi:hypothetical protein